MGKPRIRTPKKDPKKKMLKVPSLAEVDAFIHELTDISHGTDIYDALMIPPRTATPPPRRRRSSTPTKRTPPEHRRTIADIAQEMAIESLLEDEDIPLPPDFRN